MTDDPFSTSAFYKSWMAMQAQLMEAQMGFWQQAATTAESPADTGALETYAQAWSEARKRVEDWKAGFDRLRPSASGGDSIVQATLLRMMDPAQLLFAGSDEVNQTILKLVEGSDFTNAAGLTQQVFEATREWIALQEASAAYRLVVIRAWNAAFVRFSAAAAKQETTTEQDPGSLLELWLETANDEVIAAQRTQDFLTAQRNLLRAGIDYRLRKREIAEAWCRDHSIPTRTEIDELHATVYRLKRELRATKKLPSALDGEVSPKTAS